MAMRYSALAFKTWLRHVYFIHGLMHARKIAKSIGLEDLARVAEEIVAILPKVLVPIVLDYFVGPTYFNAHNQQNLRPHQVIHLSLLEIKEDAKEDGSIKRSYTTNVCEMRINPLFTEKKGDKIVVCGKQLDFQDEPYSIVTDGQFMCTGEKRSERKIVTIMDIDGQLWTGERNLEEENKFMQEKYADKSLTTNDMDRKGRHCRRYVVGGKTYWIGGTVEVNATAACVGIKWHRQPFELGILKKIRLKFSEESQRRLWLEPDKDTIVNCTRLPLGIWVSSFVPENGRFHQV